MVFRGFILQPTYRVEAGRPVVHLFGRLDTGEPFLVRDTRMIPCFFVRTSDAAAARTWGATRQVPTALRSMRGDPMTRVEVPVPAGAPKLRDALRARGIPVLEGDVRFAMRFLIDRGLRGSVEITPGPAPVASAPAGPAGPGTLRVFQDPDLAPSDWQPDPGDLRILSLDIETDPRGQHLLAAAIAGPGIERVYLALPMPEMRRALSGFAVRHNAVACGDERGLLINLFDGMRGVDFDILTGWNVIDFDLSVLEGAARRLGVPFEVGRAPGATRVIRNRSFMGRSRAEIPGRLVLDGIDLLRSAFVRLEDYRLETAARELLGEGKVALVPEERQARSGRDRAAAIEHAFREDLPRFVEYNLSDARLVLGILEKARLIDLAVRRSLLTGMPLDRVGASIASFDFLYLHEMRRRGYVAPSVGDIEGEVAPTRGGAVLEPAPGLYEMVLVYDFKSLYPSLIRTFNIDPLGHVHGPDAEEPGDLIRAPNGALFRRRPGVLPSLLADLFPEREKAKRAGDAISAHALKILMNSFYGVLATPSCRFYSSEVANAITHFGQWVLRWASDRVEAAGHRVLYGDTDSLFVEAGERGLSSPEKARRVGIELCAGINRALGEEIRRRWDVESHLELEFEALYLKLFLPSVRHGSAGARKRYAALRWTPEGPQPGEAVFVGMEVVRRDWTELSKTFQRGLFERLFRGATPEVAAAYLTSFVADLRAGRFDELLVYRKTLRKGLAEYTATTPPHVKAARRMGRLAGRVIEYVMTGAGPEPADARTESIDYEHYVEKQIRPIAEQVLPHLGVSVDEALGRDKQMKLF